VYDSLAIVGATGAVGKIVVSLLEARAFPHQKIKFLASARSVGKEISFCGKTHQVELLCPAAFDDVARDFIPAAVERGAVVVDESGAWRMDPQVPLVVPEVNAAAIAEHQGIIASPNCSTTQMVVAMKPLHDAARIRRVIVSTYQATSGAGRAGQEDLTAGTRAALSGEAYAYTTFSHPIAFNVIPQIGSSKYEQYTSEEMKMVFETQKIFADESIRVCPTCVRVPVSNCHSESILVETERPLSAAEATQLFDSFPGITVIDDLDNGCYPLPSECSDHDDVFIGRIRKDISQDNGLAFWCVSDNLRKGAATNAVQIAESLVSGT